MHGTFLTMHEHIFDATFQSPNETARYLLNVMHFLLEQDTSAEHNAGTDQLNV